MSRIRPSAVIAIALLLVPLSACTAEPSPGGSGQSALSGEVSKQDVTRWVMPLDEFASPSLMALPNYASNLLIAECLGEEGIDWPIPWQPTDDASYMPPTANSSGFPNLTVETAREFGYRAPAMAGMLVAPSQENQDALMKLNAIAASTPGFDPLFNSCLEQARKTLPDHESAAIYNQLNGWNWEAMGPALQEVAVQEGAAAWKSCLLDEGYPVDLAAPFDPDADEAMPTQALLQALGIPSRYQPGDGGPENPLTQAEIDLAVADATCRQSSGWNDATYQALWTAQLKIIDKHADELVRMREEGRKLLDDSLKIIAEHAPAH